MGYGDEKVVVEVTEARDGALEYVATDGKKHTYYPARRFSLNLQDLQVWQYLREPSAENPSPEVVSQLRGSARLEDYGISVIGEPDNHTRTLAVQMLGFGKHSAFEDVDRNALGFSLSKPVGVGQLGFLRADWEIGNSSEWFLSCSIPEAMLRTLIKAVTAGTLKSLGMSCSMNNLYMDDHPYAPVSTRSNLFLRPSLHDNTINSPEMASGYVMGLGAALSKVDMRPEEVSEDDDAREQMEVREVSPDPVALAVASLAASVTALRSTIKWMGGIAAVCLVVIALK